MKKNQNSDIAFNFKSKNPLKYIGLKKKDRQNDEIVFHFINEITLKLFATKKIKSESRPQKYPYTRRLYV